ncbi:MULTISPECIES: DUF934 domain-containing protein [unclassified Paludibacterium]|uniref:DUF934 domain-containing protein n=1 Tax=unclassified Paludibacterium TaxID=2618429 RepID=UPI001C03AA48|nr:DUF934 domain-containing protein [Paludibacterium sp. B53371]BEV72012.1 DUF934 domain-containing protein [Paludibacterium sp. THUN1379]
MQNIIDRHGLREDRWVLLRQEEDGQLPSSAPDDDIIVPLPAWLSMQSELLDRPGRTAVWLAPDHEPGQLQPSLNLLTLIAIDFPSFTDGRGYSIARLLRERYNYAGELRALGDVWQDQVQALWLVGFDSFEIKPGKPLPQGGLAGAAFSEHYQTSFRQPQPLFRRCISHD